MAHGVRRCNGGRQALEAAARGDDGGVLAHGRDAVVDAARLKVCLKRFEVREKRPEQHGQNAVLIIVRVVSVHLNHDDLPGMIQLGSGCDQFRCHFQLRL